MTEKDPRIVGALSRLNHPVERLPPGFIALFVWSRSRRRPPTMELLQRIVHGYGLDIQDVLREAGFRHVVNASVGGGGT